MQDNSKQSGSDSTPPDYNLYEYSIIRFVPDIERGEAVNVGLIMMCKRRKWLKCSLHLDQGKIEAIAPHADVAALRSQLEMFTMRDVPQKGLPVEETYRWLTAPKSATLQPSPSHPGISQEESLEDTFLRLFKMLVK